MPSESEVIQWFDDYVTDEDEDGTVDFDLSVTPNDFNVSTLFNFIEAKAIVIPSFQRHYVWDMTRASKLIESLILGLPVPQLFLYEQGRNKFFVIDGQQRLMSIYYFIKQRFPRINARAKLRSYFNEQGGIPDNVFANDELFRDFRLLLPTGLPDRPNLLSGLSYETLGERKFSLDLRPIRNVIVKQNSPQSDDSAIYEIFSRLNSGGVNLTSQEIRLSLYHSTFYDSLMQMDLDERWRKLLNRDEPDLHLKDLELLLRLFAMLMDSDNYAPSMVKFLNQFSHKLRTQDEAGIKYLERLFDSFLVASKSLPKSIFLGNNRRLNIALVEATFAAACSKAFQETRLPKGRLNSAAIRKLKEDTSFIAASTYATTQTANVRARLDLANKHIKPL